MAGKEEVEEAKSEILKAVDRFSSYRRMVYLGETTSKDRLYMLQDLKDILDRMLTLAQNDLWYLHLADSIMVPTIRLLRSTSPNDADMLYEALRELNEVVRKSRR